MENARIQTARTIAMDLLTGAITQRTHPALFDDDIVYFNVRLLEEHDGEWLLAQLADERHAHEHRLTLARNMAGPLHRRALAILGVEY